jgi:hypothetical protein
MSRRRMSRRRIEKEVERGAAIGPNVPITLD